MDEKSVSKRAAVIYTSISVVLAVIFYLFSGFIDNNPVSRWGGAIWVFILSMIITMPIVIPAVKKRYNL